MKINGPLRRLFEAGIPVWVVGGALRDLLAGRIPRDCDLLVAVDAATLFSLLPEGKWVGRSFQTLALPHLPGSAGGGARRGTSKGRAPAGGALQIGLFSGDLPAELGRRDFSINALAIRIDPGKGRVWELIDPFGGRADLERGILRRPDPGRDPFSEDPVRVLRLARFVSDFGFSVERETLDAAVSAVFRLRAVAEERVRGEWLKLFSGRFLKGLFDRLPPEFVGRLIEPLAGGMERRSRKGEAGGGRSLPRALERAARFSRFDPLFRLWFFLEAGGFHEGEGARSFLSNVLPWSREERRRLSRWSRLAEFLCPGREERAWTVSDRTLVLAGQKDHLREIVDHLAGGLPASEKRKFRERVEQTVSELSRPWSEIGDRLKRVKKRGQVGQGLDEMAQEVMVRTPVVPVFPGERTAWGDPTDPPDPAETA